MLANLFVFHLRFPLKIVSCSETMGFINLHKILRQHCERFTTTSSSQKSDFFFSPPHNKKSGGGDTKYTQLYIVNPSIIILHKILRKHCEKFPFISSQNIDFFVHVWQYKKYSDIFSCIFFANKCCIDFLAKRNDSLCKN